MWYRFAATLRCARCGGQLSLQVFDEARVALDATLLASARKQGLHTADFDRRVEAGSLSCDACLVDYPIAYGLPVLLPYETDLHRRFRAEFKKHAPASGFRFANDEPMAGERFVLGSFSTEWLAYDYDGVIWEMDYANHERRFLLEMQGHEPAAEQGGGFLEVGCGIGLTTEMAQRNFRVDAVGMDLSLAALRASKRHEGNPFLHFVQASVFHMPFASGAFESIYSRGVLHHTSSTQRAFEAMARHVRPGGAVYLWVYGPGSIGETPLRRVLYIAERAVRWLLSGRDDGLLAKVLLYPLAFAYVLFNRTRRMMDPTIQPYNLKRALHAARDRFTPEFAHRHPAAEVVSWFEAAQLSGIEVVNWKVMPSADHDDYRRNTGVRGRRAPVAVQQAA